MSTQSVQVTRRQFAEAAAAGSGAVVGLPRSEGAELEQPFSFLLLGDTHFDRIEHHDLAWMAQHYAKDIRQVENYCRLTREQLPKLLAAAKDAAAQSDSPVTFALHVGDLVEGICGNASLAVRHCEEAWEFFKAAKLGVPLLMTKGNHDVTGPGSIEAFEKVLLTRTANELGRDKLDRSSYSFRHGQNLFAVFDAYDRGAIDWLEQTTHASEFERLFVLTHLPVVPYNARSNWRVYYHPAQAARRKRLVDLLGRYRAIVLCGHLHKHSVVVRRCETGCFAQLAISSIMKEVSATSSTFQSIDDYGPKLTELEPEFSAETLESRKVILEAEKPFIEHFEYADASGFALLDVSGKDVTASVYSGSNFDQVKRVVVSNLLS